MKIMMSHGSGGEETGRLIAEVFASRFADEALNRMEDAAAVPGAAALALTTDSFVVRPLSFPGGDIGHLAVCGTVNDLLMRGSVPQYLTCGFILEEGTDLAAVEAAAASMAETAEEAGVRIVAGDTKVVEKAHADGGILINTAGVGFLRKGIDITPSAIRPGDCLLLSGSLGEHHAAILSARMGLKNKILSDAAVLTEPVSVLLGAGIRVRAMRDVTRGGLATILHEFAAASGLTMALRESAIPVTPEIRDFCGILGLDPLTMGNEGKFIAAVAPEDAEEALRLVRGTSTGAGAALVGEARPRAEVPVLLETGLGGERVVSPLVGEGLPRIC